jgi:hypothetical protein
VSVLAAGLLALALTGASPAPCAALALAASALVSYALAYALAFRLYIPDRFYSFGAHAAMVALLVSTTGMCAVRWRGTRARIFRHAVATAVILGAWLSLGDGVVRRNHMTIDRRKSAAFYDFIATLPPNTRVASHPMDGDGIPLFSARATMGTYETLQPWFTATWRAQRKRAEDTLTAMYARDAVTLFNYVHSNRVTHLLVNRSRYQTNFVARAKSFEPLSSHAAKLLANSEVENFILAHVPASAVVFTNKHLLLVDAARLQDALKAP